MREEKQRSPDTPSAALALRWISLEADRMEEIVEQILREEAWWVAARSRKYSFGPTVWVDESPACRGADSPRCFAIAEAALRE